MVTGLATRCPACGTVFRVVPDQLRVSEGWVRCGRCSEVFNATQSLVDLDAAAVRKVQPPAVPPPPPPAPPATASPPAPSPSPAPATAHAPAPAAAPVVAAPPSAAAAASTTDGVPAFAEAPQAQDHAAASAAAAQPSASMAGDAWSPSASESGALDTAPGMADTTPVADFDLTLPDTDDGDARREPTFDLGPAVAAHDEAVAPFEAPPQAPLPTALPAAAAASAEDIGLPTAAGATQAAEAASPAQDALAATAQPEFLRRAERAERWRRPWVRALLGLAVLLGLGGLAGQVLHEYRDLAAARYPQLRPWLEQGCTWLDCRVGAARAIDSLAVESSGLVRVESSDLYRLNVVLRNRSGIPLALPALDLALTDRQGRLIARKVLRAGELGAAGETLAAGAEATLAGTLRAGNGPVAGYTVELFYP